MVPDERRDGSQHDHTGYPDPQRSCHPTPSPREHNMSTGRRRGLERHYAA